MKRVQSQQLSKILEDYFNENPELADKMAENRLASSWEKVLGVSINKYTGDMYVKKRCLYVRLTSSVVKNELMMCRERLIQNLNEDIGRNIISDIIFI